MGIKRMIKSEELKEQHREVAQLIGVENLIRLSENYGGTTLYIPKVDDLLKNSRHAAILREFDGTNIRYLARKYHVSERTVYRLVKDMLLISGRKPMEGQLSFFGNEAEIRED